MKVWEAHRDLSLSLGDSVGLESYTLDSPPDTIPDGVRASKALRDSYLYRAMLNIVNDLLRQVIGLDKLTASNIISKVLPSMVNEAIIPVSDMRMYTWLDIGTDALGGYGLLYLLSVILTDDLNNKNYPIPIKSQQEKNKLMNSRNIQRPDAFCTYMTQVAGIVPNPDIMRLFIYDGTSQLEHFESVILTYLAYPKNPATQELDEDIFFEESYYNTVIELATIFGMADSQEIQSPERFYPQTLDTKIGVSNAGQFNK